MRLKGEYKIELRDAKTGKVTDTRIGHNFVTDFTQEQLKHYGGRQPQSSYSLDGYFGGIMCFDSAINENTDMTSRHSHPIFAPSTKNMTANGCVDCSTSSASVTELGAYNLTESANNNGRSRRYVYDWDTNEGNGTIACVCLTSKESGWKGVGNKTSGNYINETSSSKPGYQYDDFSNKGYRTNYTLGGDYPRVAYVNGNKVGIIESADAVTATSVTIKEYDLPQTTQNPFNGAGSFITYARYTETTYTIQNGHAGTTSGVIIGVGCQPGYWWIFRKKTNSTNWYLDIINNDDTVESYVITNPHSDNRTGSECRYCGVVKLGGYIIFTGSYNNDNSTVQVYSYNIATTEISMLGTAGLSSYYRMGLIMLEGVVYGDGFIVKIVSNAPVMYYRNFSINAITIDSNIMGNYKQDMLDAYRIWSQTATNYFSAIGLPGAWLATIANLSQPVIKTADKTMKITYTLTLQED